MEETVTRVKLARAMRATQRRLRVRLRVALRRARVGRERPATACGVGRSLMKARARAAKRRREPPPRKAAVVSIFLNAPAAKSAMAASAPKIESARGMRGGL